MSSDWTDPASGPAAQAGAALGARRSAARRTLDECWTPIRTALTPRIGDMLVEALGAAAKSADEVEARRAKSVLLRDKAFSQAYIEALQSELSAAVAAFVDNRAAGQAARGSLSLVELETVEHSTLVEQAAARIRNGVDEPFVAVKLRLANLVREFDVREIESPFRVAVFVRALNTALRNIGVGDADVGSLLRYFPPAMVKPLADSYAAIDRFLRERGVSAELQARPPTLGAATRFSAAVAATTGSGQNTDSDAKLSSGLAAAQVLNSLYQRLNLAAPATAAPPVGAPPPAAGEPAAGSADAALAAAAARLRAAESSGPAELAPGTGWRADPKLLNSIGEVQRLGALAMATVLQGRPAPDAAVNFAELRGRLAETASRKVDKLTIELVGLLFDRINRDRYVPEQIKELIGRLQFPLLKVALTDPELFVSPDQAARRLLDRIASTSVGWSAQGEDNARYLAGVQAAVHAVLASTGDPNGAFDRAYAQFETFLEGERTRDDDPVARARRALAEAENREIRAIKTTMQVRSAFDGVQLESYLRDFLLQVWVRVLIEASNREKAEPGLMRKYLDAVPELVWSVQPKISQDDRRRMISTIPVVLSLLREGLRLVDWPAPRVQEFFGKLMNSHANAVKALEIAHGAPQQFVPSTLRIKLDGFKVASEDGDLPLEAITISDDAVRHVLAETGAGVMHLSKPEDADFPAPSLDHHEAERMVAGWRSGMWFDLRVGGQLERVKLSWVSPRATLYLFTSAHGERAHSLSPENLVSYLQAGWLVPVEQAPLFSRAVEGVMWDLKHAAQPPAGDAA